MHRDVSPQNILVGLDGVARITDFGIAKIATEHEHSATNALKGKLAYLAPEYIEHRAFDARSDVYAIAVVAWESLARRRLFKGADQIETLKLVTERGPLPLGDVVPELGAVSDVLARAMARFPNERFDSVAAFADALRTTGAAIATHEEVAGFVESAIGESVRARRRAMEAFPVAKAGAARDAMSTVSVASDAPKKSPRTRWLVFGALGIAGITGIAFGARTLLREHAARRSVRDRIDRTTASAARGHEQRAHGDVVDHVISGARRDHDAAARQADGDDDGVYAPSSRAAESVRVITCRRAARRRCASSRASWSALRGS